MKKIFLDTNFLLRFLLKDIVPQHLKAKKLLLKGAKNQVRLFTTLIVFFELYWVLTSFYQKNKGRIAEILKEILKLQFIFLQERKLISKAIEVYIETGLDLEDAFNLVFALQEKADEVATFDKNLQKEFSSKIK